MKRTVILGLALACSLSAQACEPILPFMQVVGGPAVLTGSLIVLLAAVGLKSVAFAAWQPRLGFWHGLLLMIAGNLLTTVIGVIAAVMLGSGPLMLVGVVVAWGLAVLPARRLIASAPLPWLKHFHPGGLAGVMALALGLSVVLFSFAQMGMFSGRPMIHWAVKLTAVYLALMVSIILTAFWEEWVIWRLSSYPEQHSAFVQPVVRANLLVLLAVMLYAAAVMLPHRLKSPNFLVKPAIHEQRGPRGQESLPT
jgi:hypothetical protein